MTAPRLPSPKSLRKARHDKRAYFDFNVIDRDPTPANAAAAWANRDIVSALFARLEESDAMLSSGRSNPRAAAIEALRAVIDFASSSPHGSEGRFSRPLELLADDLGSMPPALTEAELFPPIRGWAGRRAMRRVQGSAAYALQLMRGPDLGNSADHETAAGEIARLLKKRGFPFAGGRTNNGGAVIAWGKGNMAAAAVAQLDRLRSNPPAIKYDADPIQRQIAVLLWLGDVLEEAGWG